MRTDVFGYCRSSGIDHLLRNKPRFCKLALNSTLDTFLQLIVTNLKAINSTLSLTCCRGVGNEILVCFTIPYKIRLKRLIVIEPLVYTNDQIRFRSVQRSLRNVPTI